MTLFDLGPHPRARSGDPQTSLDAARSISPGRTEAQIEQVLARFGPLTADELCQKLPTVYPPSLKSALARARVEDSGLRRPSLRGRSQIVWRLIP
jgi:hypothetical protein